MIDDVAYEPKNKKRAVRRHHNDRMKKKTKRMFKDIWHDKSMLTDERIGKWCNNLAICSCGGCGNQRKWMGETLQERKAKQSETDYWNEDILDEWLWEEGSDGGYWDWLSGYSVDKDYLRDYCWLCKKEFFGVCSSCGYRPDEYW